MLDDQSTEKFVQHLTEHQQRIYGYIFSLVGDHNRAADILQETNLVLWRKHDEFRTGEPFAPWAFTIARFQVLAHLRDRKRDRMLLDEGLIGLLADSAVGKAMEVDQVRVALRSCMKRLTDKNLDLLQRRYFGGNSVRELAKILDRGESAIKVALMRIRHRLADCIKMEIRKKNEITVRKSL